ncbi:MULTISPECIES: YjaG family protein [unclassified Stenotrophomonas]|uniref:YjaG family protein n=1 Tax=Stenotrophomonas TaxID=40323 RepID=UPI000E9D547B|nr:MULTISPECIES: YjaG family protein [unclassified Stenotrophomonas]MBD3827670.1 DUF416 family protein [Stenotrophomonas sp.]HBS64365.1 hypothetical protein [Stenotrophomonas sp.]
MESFDEARLLLATEGMPDWKRVAFMAYCCERMLPNYRSFQVDSGYGDLAPMRKALDAVWEWAASNNLPLDLAALASACEQQAPDTAEFSSIYTSAALDAATATAATLEALVDAAAKSLIEVATYARDTIDLFVQEVEELDPNAPDLERRIIEHALMQSELRTQRESLATLKDTHEERGKAGIDLRARWSKIEQGSLSPLVV